jgi:hypothetical protein
MTHDIGTVKLPIGFTVRCSLGRPYRNNHWNAR